MEEIEKSEIVKVEYPLPKLSHRVLANLLDIIIFLFIFVCIFLVCRSFITSSSSYRDNDLKLATFNLSSGLFVEEDGNSDIDSYEYGDRVITYTSYLDSLDTLTYKDKCKRCETHINKFINNFLVTYDTSITSFSSLAKDTYDDMRLDLVGDVEGHEHYFIKDPSSGEITIPLNSNELPYYSYKLYYDNFYKSFLSNTLIDNYLTNAVPNYKQLMQRESIYLLAVEVPISYVFAAILTYFVPPLFFRRGRMTLGKALYHIGLVDTRVLSPSFARFLLRFIIFLFLELLLSLVTFGIPFIISFTLMITSKKKQGFPDYILGLTEIDASKTKIYFSRYEALTDKAINHKKAVDFELPLKN